MNHRYPLTPMQRGMLLHDAAALGDGVYIQQFVCELREVLDVASLRSAWERVVDRHAILRTAFDLEGPSGPAQEVHPRVPMAWEEWDWSGFGAEDAARRLDAYMRQDRRRGFEFGRPPLWRIVLVRLAEDAHRLVWTSHHALLDGRSRRLVLHELFAFYGAFRRSGDLPLGQPPAFGDHARFLAALDHAAAESYWKALLAGFAAPNPLPMARRSPTSVGAEDESHHALELRLSEQQTQALRSLAEANEISLNTVLQGAWAILLAFCTGAEDVVFGATRACRRSSVPGAESMVGLLINTVPVRARVMPSARPLLPWLQRLRSQWLEMRPHEHTPLAEVRRSSEVPAGTPLFETLVVFEDSRPEDAFGGPGGAEEVTGRRFRLTGITGFPPRAFGLRRDKRPD